MSVRFAPVSISGGRFLSCNIESMSAWGMLAWGENCLVYHSVFFVKRWQQRLYLYAHTWLDCTQSYSLSGDCFTAKSAGKPTLVVCSNCSSAHTQFKSGMNGLYPPLCLYFLCSCIEILGPLCWQQLNNTVFLARTKTSEGLTKVFRFCSCSF